MSPHLIGDRGVRMARSADQRRDYRNSPEAQAALKVRIGRSGALLTVAMQRPHDSLEEGTTNPCPGVAQDDVPGCQVQGFAPQKEVMGR